jgi:uncharacterized protein (TIGR02996 family)
MTMTLRYDIGRTLSQALTDVDLFALLGMSLHDVSRWGGSGNPRRECQCFSISLPGQIGLAVQLIHSAVAVCQKPSVSGVVRNGARTLAKNLRFGLGLIHPFPEAERGFLSAIHNTPDEVANWMAYADWLSEQDGRDQQRRGLLIASWLGPKAVKVKNGTTPLLPGER